MSLFSLRRLPTFSPTRARLLAATLLACALGAYALSWRLWGHQERFPAVPFFAWVPYPGPGVSWTVFAAALLALAVGLFLRPRLLWLHLLLMLAVVLPDQHRFQPWTWHYALCAVAWAVPSRRGRLLVLLTLGIYFWSGIQKLNADFVVDSGPYMLAPLLDLFGVTLDALPATLVHVATLLMAAVEVALVPLLFFARTRRAGVVLATLMHLGIFLSLGPLGRDANAVVWPWNLYMAVQVWLLFWPAREPAPVDAPAPGSRLEARLATGLLAVALVLPAAKPFGGCDPYPSFALYSDYNEYAVVWLPWDAHLLLPEEVRTHTGTVRIGPGGGVWVKLSLYRWSLEALGVPPYLGTRFYAGVAVALSSRADFGDGVILERHGLPGLFDLEREVVAFSGEARIRVHGDGYRLNVAPVDNLFASRALPVHHPIPPPAESPGELEHELVRAQRLVASGAPELADGPFEKIRRLGAALPEADPRGLMASRAYATHQLQRGRLDAAESSYRALGERYASVAPGGLQSITIHRWRAVLAARRGAVEKARALLDEARTWAETLPPSPHPIVGEIALEASRLSGAAPPAERLGALAQGYARLLPDHPRRADLLELGSRDPRLASTVREAHLREVLRIRRLYLPPQAPGRTAVLTRLAELLREEGREQEIEMLRAEEGTR